MKITLIQSIHFALIVSAIMGPPLAKAVAAPIEHSINLTPAEPTASWQVDLQPEMSAKLTVTISETGSAQSKDWKLLGTPVVVLDGDDIVWTGSLTGLSGDFTVVNTSPGSGSTTVKVSCEWGLAASGSGGGGGLPPAIKGLASGVAIPGIAQVSWSFYPVRQLADGLSPINWTIYFFNSEGEPVEGTTVESTLARPLSGPTGAWNISPTSGSGSFLSGTITSSQVSTGKLEVKYSGDGHAVSDTIVGFNAPLFLEVFTPLE